MDTPTHTNFYVVTVVSTRYVDQNVFIVEAESEQQALRMVPVKADWKIAQHMALVKTGVNRIVYGTMANLPKQQGEVSPTIREESSNDRE